LAHLLGIQPGNRLARNDAHLALVGTKADEDRSYLLVRHDNEGRYRTCDSSQSILPHSLWLALNCESLDHSRYERYRPDPRCEESSYLLVRHDNEGRYRTCDSSQSILPHSPWLALNCESSDHSRYRPGPHCHRCYG
jgi:hypothetical protein